MAQSNNNMDVQTHDRFLDAGEEPCRMLQPIEGYQQLPLVSLEESVEPILCLCPDIRRRVYIAKENCRNLSNDPLSVDERAAIYLYTTEWQPRTECLYVVLNRVLRSEHRNEINPWLSYLKLLLTALFRLSSNRTVVWRGVRHNLSNQYEVGQRYVWWTFSACMESIDALESQYFLGKTGERTLFNISCNHAKKIASYSYIRQQDEVILLPATQFLVMDKLNPSPGLYIIHLQEVEAEFPLLESLSVTSSVSPPSPMYCNIKLAQRITRCLRDCMYIGEFDVTDCDIPLIVQEAIGAKKCSFLDLNHNTISAKGARLIANALTRNTSLKVLRFWHNHLSDSGAAYIAHALCSNTSLTTLCFASNGLTDACIADIARMMKENRTLAVIYLDNNTITDEGVAMLMNALHNHSTFQQVYLHNNAITDKSNKNIEKMLRSKATLQVLSLGHNQFSEQGRTHLRNLAKLRHNFHFFL